MTEGSAASKAGSRQLPHFVRPGFNNIAPYIVVEGAARLIDFLKAAFGGVERIRVPQPKTLDHACGGWHREFRDRGG